MTVNPYLERDSNPQFSVCRKMNLLPVARGYAEHRMACHSPIKAKRTQHGIDPVLGSLGGAIQLWVVLTDYAPVVANGASLS